MAEREFILPASKPEDDEDVVWGLSTATALWARGERRDAIVWLRRAADAATAAGQDFRASELGMYASSLEEGVARAEAVPERSSFANEADIDLEEAPPSTPIGERQAASVAPKPLTGPPPPIAAPRPLTSAPPAPPAPPATRPSENLAGPATVVDPVASTQAAPAPPPPSVARPQVGPASVRRGLVALGMGGGDAAQGAAPAHAPPPDAKKAVPATLVSSGTRPMITKATAVSAGNDAPPASTTGLKPRSLVPADTDGAAAGLRPRALSPAAPADASVAAMTSPSPPPGHVSPITTPMHAPAGPVPQAAPTLAQTHAPQTVPYSAPLTVPQANAPTQHHAPAPSHVPPAPQASHVPAPSVAPAAPSAAPPAAAPSHAPPPSSVAAPHVEPHGAPATPQPSVRPPQPGAAVAPADEHDKPQTQAAPRSKAAASAAHARKKPPRAPILDPWSEEPAPSRAVPSAQPRDRDVPVRSRRDDAEDLEGVVTSAAPIDTTLKRSQERARQRTPTATGTSQSPLAAQAQKAAAEAAAAPAPAAAAPAAPAPPAPVSSSGASAPSMRPPPEVARGPSAPSAPPRRIEPTPVDRRSIPSKNPDAPPPSSSAAVVPRSTLQSPAHDGAAAASPREMELPPGASLKQPPAPHIVEPPASVPAAQPLADDGEQAARARAKTEPEPRSRVAPPVVAPEAPASDGAVSAAVAASPVPAPAPPAAVAPAGAVAVAPPSARPASSRRSSPAAERAALGDVFLDEVDAFVDLPPDEQAKLAAVARVEALNGDEEIGGFGAALLITGGAVVCARLVDAPAARVTRGAVVVSRGTLAEPVALRVVADAAGARIAVWDQATIDRALAPCPWILDELRARGDRVQALAGATIGPLGDVDEAQRNELLDKLDVRVAGPSEVLVERGAPAHVMLVGAGTVEVGGDDDVARPGDFVFSQAVLEGQPGPFAARAGAGGAVLLVGDRAIAKQLLVTTPALASALTSGS